MIDELYGKSAIISGVFDNTLAELPFSTESKFYSSPRELDNLINNSLIDSDKQGICAIYILTSLTLVNSIVAEALPWLYQSVIN